VVLLTLNKIMLCIQLITTSGMLNHLAHNSLHLRLLSYLTRNKERNNSTLLMDFSSQDSVALSHFSYVLLVLECNSLLDSI
jgi:hypothetical protein